MGFLVGAIAAVAGVASSLGAVGSALLSVGLSLGLSLVSSLFAKKPKKVDTPSGVETSVQYGGSVARQVALGKVGTAGQIVYYNTYGETNKYLHMVFALSEMWCEGLTGRVWINDEWKTLEQFDVPAGENQVANYHIEGYGGNIVVRFFDGRPGQGVDQNLVDNASTDSDGNKSWLAGNSGEGVCYVSLKLVYDEDKFPDGIPTFLWELYGARLYDPRYDSSVGGSGNQRFERPETWVYTPNPAVALYHFRRGFFVNGERVCGMSMPAYDLLTEFYMSAANICDETVYRSDGVAERRYRLSLIAKDDAQHWDAIEAMQQAMAGFEVELAGQFACFPGAAQIPVMTISDGDIVVGQPVKFTAKAPRDQLANAVFGTYIEPEDQWQSTAFEPITSVEYESLDGGERIVGNVDLSMVQSKTQAERIAKIRMGLSRMQATASLTLGYHCLALEAGDWIVWDSKRFGKRTWIIAAHQENPDSTITLQLKETDAAVYSAEGLNLHPYAPPIHGSGIGLATTIYGLVVQASTITQGTVQVPALDVTWAPPNDERVIAVILEYRVAGSIAATRLRDDTPEDGKYTILQGIYPGLDYEVRATIDTDPPRLTEWTEWVGIQTTDANPFFDQMDAVIASRIATAKQAVADLNTQVDETLQRLALQAAQDNGIAALDRQDIVQEIRAGDDRINATYSRYVTTLQAADRALAQEITTLSASITGSLEGQAEVILGLEASVREVDGKIEAVASNVSKVSTTVGNNTASLSTLQTSMNGVKVQFGVVGTINRQTGGFVFTGVQRLDGTVAYTMQIDGDAIVTGTITAAALDTQNAVITQTAQIRDLTVGSLKIKDNAVTVPVVASADDLINAGAGGYNGKVLDATIVFSAPAGKAVSVFVAAQVNQGFDAEVPWQLDLWVNGQHFTTQTSDVKQRSVTLFGTIMLTGNGGDQSVTAELWWTGSRGSYLHERTLFMQAAKR